MLQQHIQSGVDVAQRLHLRGLHTQKNGPPRGSESLSPLIGGSPCPGTPQAHQRVSQDSVEATLLLGGTSSAADVGLECPVLGGALN